MGRFMKICEARYWLQDVLDGICICCGKRLSDRWCARGRIQSLHGQRSHCLDVNLSVLQPLIYACGKSGFQDQGTSAIHFTFTETMGNGRSAAETDISISTLDKEALECGIGIGMGMNISSLKPWYGRWGVWTEMLLLSTCWSTMDDTTGWFSSNLKHHNLHHESCEGRFGLMMIILF